MMEKIVPFLWFDNQAEEAVDFYTSVFKNSRILNTSRYGEAGAKSAGRPVGSAMVVDFEIEGQRFSALNGGPLFKFTEAVSFLVNCDTQEEVDELWEKLSAGGQPGQCGWLKDKFGVSWQIVPIALELMLSDPDPQKSQRVMKAMLTMGKIDLKTLQDAYAGE